jgi:stage II sporulation protein D
MKTGFVKYRLLYFTLIALIGIALASFTNLKSISHGLRNDEIVNVRVLSQVKIQSLLFSPEKGKYLVVSNGKTIDTLSNTEALRVSISNDSIYLKKFEATSIYVSDVRFVPMNPESNCKVKLINPDRKPRYFDDQLWISNDNSFLRLVNRVVLDHYIAGVSEAEAGSRSSVEFYKVQAILARTYALAHLYKHGTEGFNLCDQVHCQAFYGKSRDPEILEAVKLTHGMVVVDDDMNLITAAFHSNSGGQTVNSEDVWGAKTTYLRSVIDTFSYRMPNARWERKMLAEDWLSYLKLKHNYPIEISDAKNEALNFKQSSRKVFLEHGGVKVPLRAVRTDLQLKSTFFSTELRNDTVIFRGRGFGHGIGMCQEGAMRMTKLGYNYKSILNFYYQNIHLIDLNELNFFKD